MKNKQNIGDLDEFTKGYLIAALWAETDNSTPQGGEPLDNNYDLIDFVPEAIEKAKADCLKFQTDNKELLEKVYSQYIVKDGTNPQQHAGHDFWLTRTGSGVGFWDRGFGKDGELLTEKCKEFGECHLSVYLKKIYFL